MALTRGWIRNAATTPLDARLLSMALVVATDTAGNPRPGVLGPANVNIVTATGTMSVNVAAAEFATTKGKGDGVTIFTNDGTVNVAIGAAPGSNSRIDVVWVKHNDNTTGDADSLPVFGVTAGTAAASPVPAAIPTGALELAQVRIYAGTTATNGGSNTVTQTYQCTAARGAPVSFRTKAALDAWTTAQSGQLAFETQGNALYRRNGSAWVIVTDVAFSSSQVTVSTAGTVTNASAMGALTSVSITTSVTAAVATKARVSLSFRYVGGGTGTGSVLGVALTGATTLTPLFTDPGTVLVSQQVPNYSNTCAGSWFVNLLPGTTNFAVVGQATGPGGTRTVSHFVLTVEPVT